MAVGGCRWLSVAVGGCRWLSVAVGGICCLVGIRLYTAEIGKTVILLSAFY